MKTSKNTTDKTNKKYWAFISYRHADNLEQDRDWASWLHKSIETYDVPAELIGTKNDRGDIIPERIYPVFRDEESLPADADLANSITNALDNSLFLVALCSPRAVESKYVAQEIEHFKATGKGNRIIAAIIAGEPGHPENECFPEPIREVVNQDGKLSEPIAADFRLLNGEEGYTSAEAYKKELLKNLPKKESTKKADKYDERLQLMKLKIIAGILGLPLETIRDRDKAFQLQKAKKRQRILSAVIATVSLLAIVAAVGGFFALKNQKLAESRKIIAENALKEKEVEFLRAEQEKERAILQEKKTRESLATADFLEGSNKLNEVTTARQGLALLARSVRNGSRAALIRLNILLQQQDFWIQTKKIANISWKNEEKFQTAIPPNRFKHVIINSEKYKTTWYSESEDKKRCVTVVSDSLAGEGVICFRVWHINGKPITPWNKIKYTGNNYLAGISSATLSPNGNYLAVVANPWREPEYIELWDVDKATPLNNDKIPAEGLHPDRQFAFFSRIEFTSSKKSNFVTLVTQSSKGDAMVSFINNKFPNEPVFSVVNSHSYAVQHTEFDPINGTLVSSDKDRNIQITTILDTGNTIRHWPVKTKIQIKNLQISHTGSIQYQLENGHIFEWIKVAYSKASKSKQTALSHSKEKGFHEILLNKDQLANPVTVRRYNSYKMQLSNNIIELYENKSKLWDLKFNNKVTHANFTARGNIIIQTEPFHNTLLDLNSGNTIFPTITEAQNHSQSIITDNPLRSTLNDDQSILLSRSFLWIPPNLGYYKFTLWDTVSGRPLSYPIIKEGDRTEHVEFSESDNYLLFGSFPEQAEQRVVVSSLELIPNTGICHELPNIAEALAGYKFSNTGMIETYSNIVLLHNFFEAIDMKQKSE